MYTIIVGWDIETTVLYIYKLSEWVHIDKVFSQVNIEVLYTNKY